MADDEEFIDALPVDYIDPGETATVDVDGIPVTVANVDGSWCAFDLAVDPTWRTALTDPTAVLGLAQAMLVWRSTHAERTLTGLLLADGGVGRWPPMPSAWGARVDPPTGGDT